MTACLSRISRAAEARPETSDFQCSVYLDNRATGVRLRDAGSSQSYKQIELSKKRLRSRSWRLQAVAILREMLARSISGAPHDHPKVFAGCFKGGCKSA